LRAKGRKRQVERSKNREPRTEKQETRAKKRETRNKSQETRYPLAVRFLCVSAPLRAIERLRHEVRFLPRHFVSEPPINFKKEKKEIGLNSRRINMDFFISFGDGKFRCFGKKI
jgi:hypothetical protein